MKKTILILLAFLHLFCCTGCGRAPAQAAQPDRPAQPEATQEAASAEEEAAPAADALEGETTMEKSLRLLINGTPVSVGWEENESVEALARLAAAEPLTVQMSMYGGFEQVGSLGSSLPRNDVQTVTQAGDIVLYAGNQIVVFYGSNSWAYTRL
ncbi:MAG: hypothetical protein IJK03_00490, partial [Oscillospiraceae bacterium]|nr:hypothetical protein [Oscillospiraceae bacterium]